MPHGGIRCGILLVTVQSQVMHWLQGYRAVKQKAGNPVPRRRRALNMPDPLLAAPQAQTVTFAVFREKKGMIFMWYFVKAYDIM